MFDNIGGKIKGLTKFICWIGIILSVITGIGLMIGGAILAGLVTVVFGSLAAWLGSLAMYGFGELIDKTSYIASKMSSLEEK